MPKRIRIHLTNEEYDVLNKITSQTKTDCWFSLDVDEDGFDCVKDLERGYKITLRFAISILNDAIIPNLLSLTDKEIEVYTNLLKKLDIADNPYEECIKLTAEIYDGNANGICTEEED